MGSTGNKRVAIHLYRCLLGLIDKHGLPPAFHLVPSSRLAHLSGLPNSDSLPPYDLSTLDGSSLMLRWAFKENAILPNGSTEAENAIDRGFEALRLFNVLKAINERRSVQEDRSIVYYSLGHVVRHRKLGYRGVIYGWDPFRMVFHNSEAKGECLEIPGTNQPFYYILPDEIGGRSTKAKYVGQDKVDILVGGRVSHRSLTKYFTRYSPKLGRYIPVEYLRYMYPDHYLIRDENEESDPDGSTVDTTPTERKESSNLETDGAV